MSKKEVCQYVEIKIFTGKSSIQSDKIFNETIYQLIKNKVVDCRFKLAGVEFEEIMMRSSSMKNLEFEKESSSSGNMYICINGYFPAEDCVYLKYIRYCFLSFQRTDESKRTVGEIMHQVTLESKLQVITNVTTKEKELDNYTDLIFQNKN